MPALATLEGVDSFNRMIGDLAKIGGPGTNLQAVVHGEVVSFLKRCVHDSPSASPKHIRERADYRFNEKYAIRGSGDLKVTMNDGTVKGEAVAENVWLRSGGKFHIMRGPGAWPSDGRIITRGPRKGQVRNPRVAPSGAHWPDRIWAQYQSLIDQTPEQRAALKKEWLERAKRSRGLLKESWAQIGQSLGISADEIGVPEYALRAIGSDGKSYVNGTGERVADASGLTYTLRNSIPIPIIFKIGEGAIAARLAAFDNAVKKGLFDDLQFVTSRYPSLLAA